MPESVVEEDVDGEGQRLPLFWRMDAEQEMEVA